MMFRCADILFSDAEEERKRVVGMLEQGKIVTHMDEILPVDPDCVWHAGFCETDDPEDRIRYEGPFLDPIRARAFQCQGCRDISHLAGHVHQYDKVRFLDIEEGDHEGETIRIKIDECGHYPKTNMNKCLHELRTPMAVHDILTSYLIQDILERECLNHIDRVFWAYICGSRMISVRERTPHKLMYMEKVPRKFAHAAMLSMVKILAELQPYHFVYGNVNRNSFVIEDTPVKGNLAGMKYASQKTLKIREFSFSSIRGRVQLSEFEEPSTRLIPDTPILDEVIRNAEARIEKRKMGTFVLHGRPEDIDRARHVHFCTSVNFALNVYLVLCAMMSIESFNRAVYQDKQSKRVWESIWPFGVIQAKAVSERLIKSTGESKNILGVISFEEMYSEPFEMEEFSE